MQASFIVLLTLYVAVIGSLGNDVLPNDAEISHVLTFLENNGDKKAAEIQQQQPELQQYITYTVVSSHEIRKGEPVPLNRIDTVFNKEPGSKKDHGEFKIIHNGNLAAKIKEFRQNNEGHTPFVVLFSHYIPCFGNKNVKYSCAEELSNFMFAQNNRSEMVIGYRATYQETIADESLRYLIADGIKVLEKREDIYTDVKTLYTIDNPNDREITILQDLLFNCLTKPPGDIRDCQRCIGGNEEEANKRIAHFVNMMTFECTKQKMSTSTRMSSLTKRNIGKCFDDYIQNSVSNDCPKCWHMVDHDDYKLFINYCRAFAFHHSNYVGYLAQPDDPYSTRWEKRQMFCQDAYRKDFAQYKKQSPAVPCALRQLDAKSMCTAIKKDVKQPEKLKLDMRDIIGESRKRKVDSPQPARKSKKVISNR